MNGKRTCWPLLLVLWSVPAAAAVHTEVVVSDNDPAPDGNGHFITFDSVCVNSSGQVAFNGSLGGTTGGFNEDDSGIYIVTNGAGTAKQIARDNQPTPDGNGYFGTFFGNLNVHINEAGKVAFGETLEGTFGGNTDNYALFLGDGSEDGTSLIVRTPTNSFLFRGSLNNQDQVAYPGYKSIYRAVVGTATLLANDNQSLPDNEGILDAGLGSLDAPALNDLGQVAFRAAVYKQGDVPSSHYGIYRADGTTILKIVRTGDPAPDGNGVFSRFSNAAINNNGEVAFVATLTGTSAGAGDDQGIFIYKDGTLVTVVRRGNDAPDGNGKFLNLGEGLSGDTIDKDNIAINDAGQVAFYATFTGASGGAVAGMLRGDEQQLTQVVRTGDLAPDGISHFTIEGSFFGLPALNDAGQVAFFTMLKKGTLLEAAIYLFDDELGLVQIVRKGDAMMGSKVSSFLNQFSTSVTSKGKSGSGLSDGGHVAFKFALDDGTVAVGVATVGEDGICGDGVVDQDETCDDGSIAYASGEYCRDDCTRVPCGQPKNPHGDAPLASDALFVLKAAVGSVECDLRVCDVRAPAGIVASDSLSVLRKAVGSPETFACPQE